MVIQIPTIAISLIVGYLERDDGFSISMNVSSQWQLTFSMTTCHLQNLGYNPLTLEKAHTVRYSTVTSITMLERKVYRLFAIYYLGYLTTGVHQPVLKHTVLNPEGQIQQQ